MTTLGHGHPGIQSKNKISSTPRSLKRLKMHMLLLGLCLSNFYNGLPTWTVTITRPDHDSLQKTTG
eukprot:200218-Pyramimonas_sp.AAC.1